MNRKLRPTKSAQQRKDGQIALMLAKIENDIEKSKITLNDKGKQLFDLGKLLKAAKNEYQKAVKENKQLREYITTNKKEEYRLQKTVINKKQKTKKYKMVVYKLEKDSETENIEQDTPESEVEKIEEEQEKNEQPLQYSTEKKTHNKQVKKEN